MADVTLYHNPRCSKSRRALELMRAGGVEPQIVEYLKTPLDRDGLVELLRALQMPARDLLRRGEDEYSELGLADRLDDADSGVRFWAANGLCYLGAKAEPATPKLTKALSDPSPDVRIAAAEVLCRLNHPDAPLPVLVEALEHESPWVRLYSANVLDRIGPQALPALESIKKAAKGKDMYIRWVFGYTVKTLTD